jgi:hypothetical protein
LLSEGDLKIAKDKLNTKIPAKVFSPRYSWGKRSDWNQEAIEIAEKVINSVIEKLKKRKFFKD